MLSHFSCVWLFATLWTVAHQASPSMGFSRQECWSELPFPPPGDFPNPGTEPMSPVALALQVDSLLLSHQGSPYMTFSSVQFSCSVVSYSLQSHGLQHIRPPCSLQTLRAYSNSRPLSQWCHPTISSSVIALSSCLQYFLASGSFQMSQFFKSDGQSIGVWASASVLPMNIQDWFPLGWTGWISLQFKGLSKFFSKTTIQKQQFFGAQLSL